MGLMVEEAGVKLGRPTRWITEVVEWERMAARSEAASDVWMSQLWLGAWWEVYGAGRRKLRVLALEASAGDGTVVCPLCLDRRRGVRRLTFVGTDNRRHELGGAAGESAARLAAWLGSRRDWDELDLRGVPRAQAEAWMQGFRAAKLRLSVSEPWLQRFVPLERPWPEVEADFHAGLRRNLEQRERGLRRAGPLRMRVVTDETGLAEAFDACVAVEASGWKGASGTALACDAAACRLYRAVAFRAAARGQLSLALLYSGETLIAFELALRSERMQAGLKKGYLQAWRRFAPGQVLQRWTLREAQAAGMREMDFSGGDEPYKAEWTPYARELVDLRVYNRTPRGGAAHAGSRARVGLARLRRRARLGTWRARVAQQARRWVARRG